MKFAALWLCLLLIGCAGGGPMLVSQSQEKQMGDKAWAQILQQRPRSTDAAQIARVNRITKQLLTQVTADYDWQTVVFEDETPNAFALPNGKMGVHTGLFEVAKNDAQLAAVIAHEISHVTARHAAQRVSTSTLASIGTNILGVGLQVAGVTGASQIAQIAGVGANLGIIKPYSRTQEFEADALGVDLMARAGYNPDEALAFWKNMQNYTARGKAPPEFLSTHPADDKRIQAIKDMLPAKRLIYDRAVGA